jgi:hypothetical protein
MNAPTHPRAATQLDRPIGRWELDFRLVDSLGTTLEAAFPDRRHFVARLRRLPKALYWSVWQVNGSRAEVLLAGLPEHVRHARKLLADQYQVVSVVVGYPSQEPGRVCRMLTIMRSGQQGAQ